MSDVQLAAVLIGAWITLPYVFVAAWVVVVERGGRS